MSKVTSVLDYITKIILHCILNNYLKYKLVRYLLYSVILYTTKHTKKPRFYKGQKSRCGPGNNNIEDVGQLESGTVEKTGRLGKSFFFLDFYNLNAVLQTIYVFSTTIEMYPYKFTPLADKEALIKAFKGKTKSELPTPCFTVDRNIFISNCDKMLAGAESINADFRAHVKTHKTEEGTVYQLVGSGNGKKTDKVVVSTLMEAWNMIPLVKKGFINDILFSLPVFESRLSELASFSNEVPFLRIMLDNLEQLDILANYSRLNKVTKKWSIFVKINMGTNRAGICNDDVELSKIIEKVLKSDISNYVSLYGFYCHAGHAYGSKSCEHASSFLMDEIRHGNLACMKALEIDPTLKLQISFGSTPTGHASQSLKDLKEVGKIYGNLELHAGNYTFCDLQQVGTSCVELDRVSCRILADVISSYPDRGGKNPGEQLINAGVIALSRESGPISGFGNITSPQGFGEWKVGRLSQEHGILVPGDDNNEAAKLFPLSTRVEIVPQHSCISAASHPWYFIFDDGNEVVDVWVPWRGW